MPFIHTTTRMIVAIVIVVSASMRRIDMPTSVVGPRGLSQYTKNSTR
jgi:hypothetical protein